MAKSSYTAVLSVIDRVTAPMKKIERAFKPFNRAFTNLGNSSRQLTSDVTGIIAPLGALFGAAGLGSLGAIGSKIIGTSAQFERFQTILETVEGSAAKAKASMDWVSKFAADTPYELAQVTDAFVKLKAYGIDPQSGALMAAGDAAAAMGKPLEQAVEALADAMTGETERMKEFGMTFRTEGDKLVYRWEENGQKMVASADKNSRAQIQAMVTGLWNSRYAGAGAKLATTWDGLWSNMLDGVTRFWKMVGDAGIFEFMKGQLVGVLDTMKRMEADGSLQALATTISNELVAAFKELKSWFTDVDWAGAWSDIKGFASGVKDVVSALGGLKTIGIAIGVIFGVQVLASFLTLGSALLTLGTALPPLFALMGAGLKGLVIAAGPVGLAIAAIALAAGAIYANWETVGPWFAELWGSIKTIFSGAYEAIAGILTGDFGRAFDGFKAIGQGLYDWYATMLKGLMGLFEWLGTGVSQIFGGIGDFLGNATGQIGGFMKDGINLVTGSEEGAPAAAPRGALIGANRQNLNGQMVVKFENTPPGVKVEAGKTNQPGVAMEADVGYRSLAMP